MFFGPDLKAVVSHADWEAQLETKLSTVFLIEEEETCRAQDSSADYNTAFDNKWPFSEVYLRHGGSPSSPKRTSSPRKDFNDGSRIDEMNFWDLLVGTVSQTPFAFRPSEAIDILDVGCGQGIGAVSLHAYFGGSVYPFPGEGVTYTGVDIGPKEIEKAAILHHHRPDLRFEVADATHLEPVASSVSPEVVDNGFEVIVIRHQNASNGTEVWRSIFSEAWERLKHGGLLLITSYTCLEHNIMLEVLADLGVVPYLSGRNPHVEMSLPSDDSSGLLKRDNYVALFWKDPWTVD